MRYVSFCFPFGSFVPIARCSPEVYGIRIDPDEKTPRNGAERPPDK
jgi:hypothetical protein